MADGDGRGSEGECVRAGRICEGRLGIMGSGEPAVLEKRWSGIRWVIVAIIYNREQD